MVKECVETKGGNNRKMGHMWGSLASCTRTNDDAEGSIQECPGEAQGTGTNADEDKRSPAGERNLFLIKGETMTSSLLFLVSYIAITLQKG